MDTTRTNLGPIVIGQLWGKKDSMGPTFRVDRITVKYVTFGPPNAMIKRSKLTIGEFLDSYVLVKDVSVGAFIQTDGSIRYQVIDIDGVTVLGELNV